MIKTLALAALLSPTLLYGAALKGVEVNDIDRQANPCGDFYQFANGNWRRQNPIPAGKPRWSRRIAAHDANWLREKSVLEELSQKADWPASSIERLLGDHFASCMDEPRIDAAGLTPLKPLLMEIDAIKNEGDVQRVIRRLHELSVFVPFSVTGAMDYQEPNRYIANVAAAGLGLPDRDYYLGTSAHDAEVRSAYAAHVARTLRLAGVPESQAEHAGQAILDMEKRLAEHSLDGATAADPAATDHKFSFTRLKTLAPHVDWGAYLDNAHLARAEVNVADVSFLRFVDAELSATPLTSWKWYFQWQLLNAASPWLARDFANEYLQFADKYLGIAGLNKSRAQRCVESTESLFGEALGKKYVERYFPPADKAKAEAIVAHLRAALRTEAAMAPWMSPATKKLALEKLAATQVFVGYPDSFKSYASVHVRRDAFWDNVATGLRFGVEDDRAHIGKPTDHTLWALSPASADAYIDLQLNKAVLPAGALQPPYFTPGASDAVNYGSFGIGLAHDLTHFVDETLGSVADLEGRPHPWWTPADHRQWNDRTQCLVEEYEGYFIEPGVHQNGKRVLSESVADLAGVRIAYRALLESQEGQASPDIDGYTPEQQFFIAWGQTSGTAMTIEAQRQFVAGDPHPVGKFRVIGPLSDTPEFARAFACRAGDAMVKAPDKTCQVW